MKFFDDVDTLRDVQPEQPHSPVRVTGGWESTVDTYYTTLLVMTHESQTVLLAGSKQGHLVTHWMATGSTHTTRLQRSEVMSLWLCPHSGRLFASFRGRVVTELDWHPTERDEANMPLLGVVQQWSGFTSRSFNVCTVKDERTGLWLAAVAYEVPCLLVWKLNDRVPGEWDGTEGEEVGISSAQVPLSQHKAFGAFSVATVGSILYCGAHKHGAVGLFALRVLDDGLWHVVGRLCDSGLVRVIRALPDGKHIAAGGAQYAAFVYDCSEHGSMWSRDIGSEPPEPQPPVRRLGTADVGHTDDIRAMESRRSLLLTGGDEGVVLGWNWRTGAVLFRAQAHSNWLRWFAWNGTTMYSTADDLRILHWEGIPLLNWPDREVVAFLMCWKRAIASPDVARNALHLLTKDVVRLICEQLLLPCR